MTRVALAVVLVALVVAVAWVINRRQAAAAPTQPRLSVPAQLDRADFASPSSPWLLALFTSATCTSCERMKAKVEPLRTDQVTVQLISWQDERALHERYAIEAVPCTLLADADGIVRWSTIGTDLTVTDLWAAVAEARE